MYLNILTSDGLTLIVQKTPSRNSVFITSSKLTFTNCVFDIGQHRILIAFFLSSQTGFSRLCTENYNNNEFIPLALCDFGPVNVALDTDIADMHVEVHEPSCRFYNPLSLRSAVDYMPPHLRTNHNTINRQQPCCFSN